MTPKRKEKVLTDEQRSVIAYVPECESFGDWAERSGVDTAVLQEWVTDDRAFAEAYERALRQRRERLRLRVLVVQERALELVAAGAMTGEFGTAMAFLRATGAVRRQGRGPSGSSARADPDDDD